MIVRDQLARILWASEVLVTFHYTVAMEAIAIQKPVIVVNLTGTEEPYPFVASGAAIGVYRQGDLIKTIDDVFENRDVKQRLHRGRCKFIRDHLCGVDGRSSARIVELIRFLTNC